MILNVFSDLFTYVKCLIAGDNEGLVKLRLLKQLYRTFKPSKYRYITKDKKITNLFLQKIFLLYTHILSYKSILESTIFHNDEKRAQLYLNHFIESNLTEDIRSKREKFTKEMMWQKVMESENINRTLNDIENDFNLYLTFLTKHNMPKFESEYYLLYKLNFLSTFNFELFFSKFDTDYVAGSMPNYSPVMGNEILNDLKDLYFLVASLPPRVDLTISFQKLYGRTDESFKEQAKKSQQSINKLYKLINDELSPHKLLALCKYVSEELKLRINVEQKSFSILEKYRKELKNRFLKNKDFVIEKYSEKSLLQDVQSLFEGKQLLQIKGYNDELVKALEDNNFNQISGIQAIKITKTFILELYETKIKDVINTLILEAFFNEKDFQTEFSNRFFASNELREYIIGFEESLATTGKNSFNFLRTSLGSFKSSNASSENKIARLIEILNDKIRHGNEKCATNLYKLATCIYKSLQDYKNPQPINISNIKSIKGTQNKDFINQLASCYNDIAKYIKIVKNFITIN